MKDDNLKIRVGVVGCGKIFGAHRQAVEINQDRFSLKSVCDCNGTVLTSLGLPGEIKKFENFERMLVSMKGKIDLVTIATPNSLHKTQAIAALEGGYNVLIEKPVAFNQRGVLEIERTAKKQQKRVFCVYQVRYNRSVEILKEIMGSKVLGKVRSVCLVQRWQRPLSYFDDWRGDVNVGGRTLYEVGIHYLDIMRWLFGQPKVLNTHTFKLKHKQIEFEDTIYSTMVFPGKVAGRVEVTIAAEPHNLECSLTVMAEKGAVRLGGQALNQVEYFDLLPECKDDKFEKLTKEIAAINETVFNDYGNYKGSCPNHFKVYQDLARGQGVGLAEAAETIGLIESIYEKESPLP